MCWCCWDGRTILTNLPKSGRFTFPLGLNLLSDLMTAAIPPHSHFVDINGLRLHHLDWGNAHQPPIVLLHGIRLHAHCWDDFARRFCGDFHILALDARGHGDSSWGEAGGYHLHAYYEDLCAVMHARELAPAILIGHSLGARTSMLYAHLHPERVAKLILVDMGAGLPGPIAGKDFSRITETPPPRDFGSHEEANSYLAAILKQAPREMIAESVKFGIRQREDGRYVWKYDPQLGAAPQPTSGKREWDLWEAVKTISCPTLLLRGQHSKVVTPEIAARMSAEMTDCRQEEIADAGHALFTDQPAAFANSVWAFLDSGAPGESTQARTP